jgi:hypothetical protein
VLTAQVLHLAMPLFLGRANFIRRYVLYRTEGPQVVLIHSLPRTTLGRMASRVCDLIEVLLQWAENVFSLANTLPQ